MPRYFLRVQYLGTAYRGWQFQPNLPTVQGTLNAALEEILRHPITSLGCGRTDAGVHGRGQVMHFETHVQPGENFLKHLNHLLPPDISASAFMVSPIPGAHVRFSALWRKYRYYVHFGKNPFLHHTSLRLRYRPRPELLTACAAALQGEMDLGAFAIQQAGHKHTRCRIDFAHWHFGEDQWYFEIQADRFLRGMVRMLTGSMLRIAHRNEDINEFLQYLNNPQGIMARPMAEPQGLTLWETGFPEGFFLNK